MLSGCVYPRQQFSASAINFQSLRPREDSSLIQADIGLCCQLKMGQSVAFCGAGSS